MSGRVAGVTAVVLAFYIVGCIAFTNGASEIYERLMRGAPALAQASQSNSIQESESDHDGEEYLDVAGAIVLGVSSAFCSFWKLQCGVRRWRNIWLVVLFFSFVMCAYGFGLLLELAAGGG